MSLKGNIFQLSDAEENQDTHPNLVSAKRLLIGGEITNRNGSPNPHPEIPLAGSNLSCTRHEIEEPS